MIVGFSPFSYPVYSGGRLSYVHVNQPVRMSLSKFRALAAPYFAPKPVAPFRGSLVRYYVYGDWMNSVGPYMVKTVGGYRVVDLTPAQADSFVRSWYIGTTRFDLHPWATRKLIWQYTGRRVAADVPSVLSVPLVDQAGTELAPFTYAFNAGTWTNADNSSPNYVYKARLTSGAYLPTWLTFNPLNRTFSGTPPNGSVGTIAIRVTATDAFQRAYTDDFNIVIAAD